jgi:hypothetical protein
MAHDYLREYDEDRGSDRDRRRDDDRERGWRGSDRDRDRDRNERNLNFMLGDQDRSWERNRVGSGQDDHYLSWRERQMAALDADYADYCREREQQFHQDFDAWRNQKHGNPQPLQAGMTQPGMSKDPEGTLELTNESQSQGQPDAMADATLGASSGRNRR